MIYRPHIIGSTWYNTHPLTPEDYEGKVLLIDFWTYSCVNCIRTLPYLKKWWDAYKEQNFLLIGVHTPEFEFEKDPQHVEQAIKKLDVTWPVVLDNEQKNWSNYAVKGWPSKYLCDTHGKIVYEHVGEGSYAKTENEILRLLGLKSIETIESLDEHIHGAACYKATPELYCGYKRGLLANEEGYVDDAVAEYARPEPMPEDRIGLQGRFMATDEYVESVDENSTFLLHFHATEVNLVIHPTEPHTVVQIAYNDLPLDRDVSGYDVSEASEIPVDSARMYNVIKSAAFIGGILSLKAVQGNFRAYACTFSGCEE